VSKGLGKMERAILATIAKQKKRDARRDEFYRAAGQPLPPRPVCVSSWDVAMCATGAGWVNEVFVAPTRSQLISAVRAMHSFVSKFPQYALISGKGRRLQLYERGDDMSAMWAKLNSQHRAYMGDVTRALKHVKVGCNEPFSRSRSCTSRARLPRKHYYRDISLPR
jgi:hypothetical protein